MHRTTIFTSFLAAAVLACPGAAFAQGGEPPAAPGGTTLPPGVLDHLQPQATPTPTPAPTVTPAPTPAPVAPAPPVRPDPPADGCTIRGTAGSDRLVGTGGNDVICGLGGDDVLLGKGGNDTLNGGPGRDRLDGGAGRDRLLARDGARDRLLGGAGRDRAEIDRRKDTVRSVERLAGGPAARAASLASPTVTVAHSLLNCSSGLLVGSGDLMVYTSGNVIVGVRDHVYGWTGSAWRYLTSDSAAFTRPYGYVKGADPVWYVPDAGQTMRLGAQWTVTPGSGYYGVAQWIGVWDGSTGQFIGADYKWLANIHDGRNYCRF